MRTTQGDRILLFDV